MNNLNKASGEASAAAPILARLATCATLGAEQFDYWRSHYPSVDMEPPPQRRSRNWFSGWFTNLVSPSDGTALCFTRTGPNHSRFNDDALENVLIGSIMEGDLVSTPTGKGSAQSLPRGRLYMVDLRNTHAFTTGGFKTIHLAMPRALAVRALGADTAPGNGVRILPDTVMARTLWSHLTATAHELAALPASHYVTALDTAKSLASVLLAGLAEPPHPARQMKDHVLFAAARRCMAEVMHDPSMTAPRLARLMGQSRSGLYRAFEAQDAGVHETLTGMRMEKADSLLSLTLMPVSEVARACGYSDFSAFSRAFRRRYGCTPRDYRLGHPRQDGAIRA